MAAASTAYAAALAMAMLRMERARQMAAVLVGNGCRQQLCPCPWLKRQTRRSAWQLPRYQQMLGAIRSHLLCPP